MLCRSAFRGYLGPDDHVGAGFRVLLVSPPDGVRTESGANDKPAPVTDPCAITLARHFYHQLAVHPEAPVGQGLASFLLGRRRFVRCSIGKPIQVPRGQPHIRGGSLIDKNAADSQERD